MQSFICCYLYYNGMTLSCLFNLLRRQKLPFDLLPFLHRQFFFVFDDDDVSQFHIIMKVMNAPSYIQTNIHTNNYQHVTCYLLIMPILFSRQSHMFILPLPIHYGVNDRLNLQTV